MTSTRVSSIRSRRTLRHLRLVGFAALWFGGAPATWGAPCSGFTDVDDTNSACPSVDWLRNRGVTLGCTSSTLFCPNATVVRLSMAAFMNRLGVALSPTFYDNAGGGVSLDLVNPPQTVCVTPPIPAAVFPRIAHSSAVFTAKATVPVTARLKIVTSSDGGVTWVPLTDLAPTASGSGGWLNLSVWNGNLQIPAGTVYRIGARADTEGAGAVVGNWTCQLHVAVFSRTGIASPY